MLRTVFVDHKARIRADEGAEADADTDDPDKEQPRIATSGGHQHDEAGKRNDQHKNQRLDAADPVRKHSRDEPPGRIGNRNHRHAKSSQSRARPHLLLGDGRNVRKKHEAHHRRRRKEQKERIKERCSHHLEPVHARCVAHARAARRRRQNGMQIVRTLRRLQGGNHDHHAREDAHGQQRLGNAERINQSTNNKGQHGRADAQARRHQPARKAAVVREPLDGRIDRAAVDKPRADADA